MASCSIARTTRATLTSRSKLTKYVAQIGILLSLYLAQELIPKIAGGNRALFHEEQVKCLWGEAIADHGGGFLAQG